MTTETNLLVKVNFSAFPATMPSTWYLGNFIPNGALDGSHIEARWRPAGAYWQPWEPVAAWNNTTRTATFFKAGVHEQVEFRRSTPRYAAFRDPLASTSRVSEQNFHANADQGLMVAAEWAAQYGIDAYAIPLAEPGDGPNQLGLVQQTQNHWGSNANFAKTTWDFQFAGGYIDRAHVKAQALLPTGWTQLTIDPGENDPAHPSAAPFRFIGDYQLRLDLSTLAGPVTGLVIYRHTPRNVNVTVPLDNTRITAPGMEPSARHALFVAVEIGEELTKRVPPCECELYYTSLIYPTLIEEAMTVGIPPIVSGLTRSLGNDDMTGPIPVLQSGTLISNITFNVYTNGRDFNPDVMSGPLPVLQSGTLVSVVNPVSYTNGRDFGPDIMSGPLPVLQSGTMVVTISYVIYTNGRDFNADTMSVAVPNLQSGTLV